MNREGFYIFIFFYFGENIFFLLVLTESIESYSRVRIFWNLCRNLTTQSAEIHVPSTDTNLSLLFMLFFVLYDIICIIYVYAHLPIRLLVCF